ncbi:MAG: ankyrin repeat domain-containing protein [Proteobacteria bacterium]|nr:ankyrin repeat domain-containing protein [Pseudomonadota bacterium]
MKKIITSNLENHPVNKISTLGIYLALILIFGAFAPQYAAFAQETSQPELFTAIYRGDLARARAAIESGSDVNGIYDRDTMLCWAMRNDNQEITKLILGSPRLEVDKRGVWYDSFGDWERTPLILAAHMGLAQTVSTLLQRGAQVNARGSKGNTALIKAAQRDHTETIRVLLTQGKGIRVDAQTKEGRTPLSFVVEAEDLDAVKLIHSHGAEINQPDRQGDSMLIGTFLHKKYDVLDFLVARGANINMVNNGGVTTLMTAITLLGGDDAKTVLAFLEKFITFKPELDLQQIKGNNGGYTALHLAARFGFVDGGKLLLDNGASIDLKSLATGGTPLHNAAGANHVNFAKLLINRRANLEIFDKSGSTPLILAVIHGDADMVAVLVDAGARINVKSPVNSLVTPLVYAASNPDPFKHKDNLAIIKYLVKHKGDINFSSANGRTALMAAAACSDQSKAYEKGALLIDSGANLDLVNDKGETALMLAAGASNKKLVALLLDKGANAQLKNGAGESVMSYANRSGNKDNASLLESSGVKPEAPIVHKSVIVPGLVGTWKGFQDGMPQALYTIVLSKNGTFDFNSRLTPEALKHIPKGSMNPVIAAQKGSYTFNNDLMIWNPIGAPPTSMKWKLKNGMLILDNKIRLNKSQ